MSFYRNGGPLYVGRLFFLNRAIVIAVIFSIFLHLIFVYLYYQNTRFLSNTLQSKIQSVLKIELITPRLLSGVIGTEKPLLNPLQSHQSSSDAQKIKQSEISKALIKESDTIGLSVTADKNQDKNLTLSSGLNFGSTHQRRGLFQPISADQLSLHSQQHQSWHEQKRVEDLQSQLIFELFSALQTINKDYDEINCQFNRDGLCDLNHEQTIAILGYYRKMLSSIQYAPSLIIMFSGGQWHLEQNRPTSN